MKKTELNDQALSFEEAKKRLEQTVEQLESGDLSLEKSLELFEEGMRLKKQCQEKLRQVEERIETLIETGSGDLDLVSYSEQNKD